MRRDRATDIFARWLIHKSSRPLGANSLDFIETYFANRFTIRQAPGGRQTLVYKKSPWPVPSAYYHSLLQFALSLSINQFWAGLLSQLQLLPMTAPTIIQAPGRQELLPRPVHLPTVYQQSLKEIAKPVQGMLRIFHDRVLTRQLYSSPPRMLDAIYGNQFARFDILPLQPSSLVLTRRERELLLKETRQSTVTGDLARVGLPLSVEPSALPDKRIKAGVEFIAINFAGSPIPSPTSPAIIPMTLPGLAIEKTQLARVRSLGIQRLKEFKSLVGFSFVSLLDKRLVTGTLQATGNAEEKPLPRFEQEIILLRKEQSLQSSPLNYVFTHSVHPIAEERQVIRKTEERQVIEVVKKEVQTLMTPSSILANFSRTDYLQIADHVFSTLVRRLQVEKERLGLH